MGVDTWMDPYCPCEARYNPRTQNVFWFMRDTGLGIARSRASELLSPLGYEREDIERQLTERMRWLAPAGVPRAWRESREGPTR